MSAPVLGSRRIRGTSLADRDALPGWDAARVDGVWRRRRHEAAGQLGLEEQIEALMNRYDQAGNEYTCRAAVLEQFHHDEVMMLRGQRVDAETLAEQHPFRNRWTMPSGWSWRRRVAVTASTR